MQIPTKMKKSALVHALKNSKVSLIVIFALYVAVISFINPRFISGMNIKNIFVQISITGVFSLGMLLVMLTGGIDLSAAAMSSLLGCISAKLLFGGANSALVILLVLVLGIVLGGLMGLIISRTSLEPFIVSLGFMSMYAGTTLLITNGSELSAGDKLAFLNKFPLGLSTLAYIYFSITIIVAFILIKTKFGKRLYYVGDNPQAAFYAGISVKNYKLSAYMINGFLIAIATLMAVARLNTASASMSDGKDIDAIAACVVGGVAMSGGKGDVLGVFIAVLFLGCMTNSMTVIGLSSYIATLLKGAFIVIAVVLAQINVGKAK